MLVVVVVVVVVVMMTSDGDEREIHIAIGGREGEGSMRLTSKDFSKHTSTVAAVFIRAALYQIIASGSTDKNRAESDSC